MMKKLSLLNLILSQLVILEKNFKKNNLVLDVLVNQHKLDVGQSKKQKLEQEVDFIG
jgi:hypothetical protein